MAKEKFDYKKQLQDPRWQRKRLEILQRDDFTCTLCCDKESELHVHHIKYEYGKKAWEYTDDNFQTLCYRCHEIVTRGHIIKFISIYRIQNITVAIAHAGIVVIYKDKWKEFLRKNTKQAFNYINECLSN